MVSGPFEGHTDVSTPLHFHLMANGLPLAPDDKSIRIWDAGFFAHLSASRRKSPHSFIPQATASFSLLAQTTEDVSLNSRYAPPRYGSFDDRGLS
jgi:hypothetical protein